MENFRNTHERRVNIQLDSDPLLQDWETEAEIEEWRNGAGLVTDVISFTAVEE